MRSPIHIADLVRAVGAGAGLVRRDPRDGLRAMLLAEFDADDAVLCGSGTEALQVAMRRALRAAADRADDDAIVALPAFTCYDVASAAVRTATGITLYDVDPATLGPDPASLEEVFSRGVRVAVVSPLYGIPVDWDGLEAIASRHGAILIEDAAQGHGARWRGTPLGALGSLSVLSFGRGKGWTGGRGGAALFRGRTVSDADGEADIERGAGLADESAAVVMATAQWALARRGVYGIPAAMPWLGLGETRYHPAGPVRSLTRFAAALVGEGKGAAVAEASRRRHNAQWLLDTLGDECGATSVRPPAGARSGYLRLPVRIPGGLGSLSNPASAKRSGIAAGYPTTLAALDPVRNRLVGGAGGWPGAEELARDLVTLPTHAGLTARDLVSVVDQVRARTRESSS